MKKEYFQHMGDFPEIYEQAAKKPVPLKCFKDYLTQVKMMPESSARKYIKDMAERNPGILNISEEMVSMDVEEAKSMIREAMSFTGLNDKEYMESEIGYWKEQCCGLESRLQEKKEETDQLKGELRSSSERYDALKKECSETEDRLQGISEEKNMLAKRLAEALMSRPVVTQESVKIGPKKDLLEGLFLLDTEEQLDPYRWISRRGEERTSFYQTPKEATKDLTKRNYTRRSLMRVLTDQLLGKRGQDLKKIEQWEKDNKRTFSERPVLPENTTYSYESLRLEVLKNRNMSVQKILSNKLLTNQEKLALYAYFSPYRGTEMENLLIFAAENCISADLLIATLEDPDRCDSYEDTRRMLQQFARPSEFQMKYKLAQELIRGDWYITADYNGEETRFTLVPVEELNEIRKLLNLDPVTVRPMEKDADIFAEENDHEEGERQDSTFDSTSENAVTAECLEEMHRYPLTDEDLEQSPDIPEEEE